MAEIKQFVDDGIKSNNVIIFGKSWCSYCRRAKKTIEKITDDFAYVDIDLRDDETEVQSYLRQLNGQGTVPHIYIRQEFVGGSSDLMAIPEAQLKARIAGK